MEACSLCNGEGYAIDQKGYEVPCPFCNGTGDSKKLNKIVIAEGNGADETYKK